MPRRRSFILDRGIIYVNLDTASNANSVTIAAGTLSTSNILSNTTSAVTSAIKKLKTIEIKAPDFSVSPFTAYDGWLLNSNIVITSIVSSCRGSAISVGSANFAPQGRDLICRIRKKHASNGVTTTMATISITKSTSSRTTSTIYNVSAGDTLLFDVTQVGSTRPGAGLKHDITYY